MKVIVCLDDHNGMMFNNRRQSRDKMVIKDIIETCNDKILYMNYYSDALFDSYDNRAVYDTFPTHAKEDDFCFVENAKLLPFEDMISEFIIYRWNRVYPSDFKFDIPLSEHGWTLKSSTEFPGNSHEKITKEIYTR